MSTKFLCIDCQHRYDQCGKRPQYCCQNKQSKDWPNWLVGILTIVLMIGMTFAYLEWKENNEKVTTINSK